ncbi:MAG: redoxin domain-containing protein [Gemmatimonadaceae bacterium]|nr:redoxin domain-containing protein [Gemmatimonadaceae bacterium]
MALTHATLAALLVAFANSAWAQSPPPLPGKTPGACTQQANDWLNQRVAELRTQGALTNTSYSPLRAQSQQLATACAAQFSVTTIAPGELAALGALYTFVGDTANARRAVERGLSAPGVAPRERGSAYLQAISMANRAADAFAGYVVRAEELVKLVDAFPDSLVELKLRAHSTMLGQYEYADHDDGIRYHATIVRELGRRTKNTQSILQAYESLARTAADYLHPDSALMILDDAEKELGAAANVKESLGAMRARYMLVGTKATPVVGEHWLNAPDQPGAADVGNGKVTLVQFTAHWCAPCRNSYPGMLELSKYFGSTNYETIFVTDLYGYLGTAKNLSAAEEVAADRTYYAEHHGLPFRIAIARSYAPEFTPAQRAASNDGRYQVGGIPQIVIVDKKGVIRQIVVGWDHGNTARFKAFIERLQAEP